MSALKSLNLPVDADLDSYVKERGVPVLAPTPPASAETVALVPSPPKPAANTKMAIEVPHYLPAQLRRLALERDCTIRHIILEALHQAGCTVAPEDRSKDGRRTTTPKD